MTAEIYIVAAIALLLGVAIGWLISRGDVRAARERLEAERAHVRETLKRNDEQMALRIEALREEVLKTASEQMRVNGEELRRTNTASMDELLKPVKEQFEAFRKSVEESSKENALSKRALQDKFDATMKLFALQQENIVEQLTRETSRIGKDAVALAQALKSNTKKQGNWGEMVLTTMLENSGLEENVHFFVQYRTADDAGNALIPDVVVRFPEGRSVIIDSKVSLTAYTEYFETEDADRKNELLKSHLRSVEKHIDELSAKNYQRYVENSGDFVLMFIPNESSYIAALKMNKRLLHDAYEKKVIVISPNNLMMALQLAYDMWQTDKQIKNIDKIVDRATKLYEKVSSFKKSFDQIEDALKKLNSTYESARSKLCRGRGNVLSQCEMLRRFGVSPDPSKTLMISEEMDDPDAGEL